MAADLAAAVRPRYHVAGGEQVFFARPPYLNKDLGAGEKALSCLDLLALLFPLDAQQHRGAMIGVACPHRGCLPITVTQRAGWEVLEVQSHLDAVHPRLPRSLQTAAVSNRGSTPQLRRQGTGG